MATSAATQQPPQPPYVSPNSETEQFDFVLANVAMSGLDECLPFSDDAKFQGHSTTGSSSRSSRAFEICWCSNSALFWQVLELL
jgi:hypothetical protein